MTFEQWLQTDAGIEAASSLPSEFAKRAFAFGGFLAASEMTKNAAAVTEAVLNHLEGLAKQWDNNPHVGSLGTADGEGGAQQYVYEECAAQLRDEIARVRTSLAQLK